MNARRKHTECAKGAAVRLHGYAPARVLFLECEHVGPDYSRGTWYAECVITGRGPDWKAGNIGPHGYRTGERVRVLAFHAVPRDIIRISRQSPGRLVWPQFNVRTGPGDCRP